MSWHNHIAVALLLLPNVCDIVTSIGCWHAMWAQTEMNVLTTTNNLQVTVVDVKNAEIISHALNRATKMSSKKNNIASTATAIRKNREKTHHVNRNKFRSIPTYQPRCKMRTWSVIINVSAWNNILLWFFFFSFWRL